VVSLLQATADVLDRVGEAVVDGEFLAAADGYSPRLWEELKVAAHLPPLRPQSEVEMLLQRFDLYFEQPARARDPRYPGAGFLSRDLSRGVSDSTSWHSSSTMTGIPCCATTRCRRLTRS